MQQSLSLDASVVPLTVKNDQRSDCRRIKEEGLFFFLAVWSFRVRIRK